MIKPSGNTIEERDVCMCGRRLSEIVQPLRAVKEYTYIFAATNQMSEV